MGSISKYSIDKWEKAQELLTTRQDLTIDQIATMVEIPAATLYNSARRKGWIALRDLSDIRKSSARLSEIIKDIAGQTTDVHEHTIAMVEALQNSFQIQIVRDNEGHIHYQNMPPLWPNKPVNFDQMSIEDQQKALLTIETPRLESFITDLIGVIRVKMENMTFVTKMIKGSMPKIDPMTLDLSRRIGDTEIDILASDDSRSLADALNADLKQLKGVD